MSLLTENVINFGVAGADAGTTDVESAVFDTLGMSSVVAMARLAVANSGNYLKLQHSDASGSGFEDILGSKIVCAVNHQVLVSEIVRPIKRYLKAILVRTSSSASGDILFIGAAPRVTPADNTTSAVLAEILVSPDSGTA